MYFPYFHHNVYVRTCAPAIYVYYDFVHLEKHTIYLVGLDCMGWIRLTCAEFDWMAPGLGLGEQRLGHLAARKYKT